MDIHFNDSRFSRCEVAGVSSNLYHNGTSYGHSIQKRYNLSGIVESLTIVVFDNFGAIDTVDYDIVYDGIKAHIAAVSRGISDIEAVREPVSYSFDATFDVRSGYATLIGGHYFEYENNRLVSYDNFPLRYDEQGNITRVTSSLGAVLYAYDYSTKGKKEFYITAGYQVGEAYNLAETLGWIPVQPINKRISHSISWGISAAEDYIAGSLTMGNHTYNEDGYLISYSVDGQTVTNNWKCQVFGRPGKIR